MQIARDHGIAVEKPIRGAGPRRPIVLLSRPEALAKAQERGAGVPVPLALHNGVTVTSFGKVSAAYTTQEELVMIGFSSEWTDEKGIKFISSVVDTGSGPYYTIRAVKADEDPAAVPVEVGAGLSPDVAWQAAAERQQEVMEVAIVHRRSSGAAGGDDGMEPGDHLLVKAATLAGYWGQERFGLADIKCLQALEGQPGVPDTCYQFVEERSSWDEEGRQLLREAGQHGIGRVPMRSISSSRSRAARHPKSKEERDAAIVQRIMDGMIRQLEAGEARAAAAAQRAALRRDRELQRTLEKEQKKLLKER